MAKEFKYEIKEFIAPLKENDKNDWVKAVTRISWNDGPANIDIRNLNMTQEKIGKGISITDEEADKLTEILLDEGFGSVNKLEEALKKRKCFVLSQDDLNNCFSDDEDEKLIIDIEV